MKKITAYKCSHCAKMYQREKMCERHEKRCNKNPENWRACSGCKFLDKISTFDSSDRIRSVFYCSKKDIYLHPPKSEHKGNAFEFSAKSIGNEKNNYSISLH